MGDYVRPAQDVPGTSLSDGIKQLLGLLKRPDVLRQMQARTGMSMFDRHVAPRRGQLVILGGENGSGKSSMAMQLMLSAARNGERGAIFSTEDVGILLRARLLGMAAGVNPSRILDNEISPESDWPRIGKCAHECKDLPLSFFEGESSVDAMLETMQQLAACETRFVCVDYLQNLNGPAAQDRRNEIRRIVQKLALFARKERMCLILVSQVVRPQSRSVGAEPNRHWLKEAGDIADAADKIVLMWREQDGSQKPTNIKLDKDKDGRAIGKRWSLHFSGQTGLYTEMEAPSE